MDPALIRRVSVIAVLYGALCLARRPAALLAAGIGAINWLMAILTAMALCVSLSRVAWRRYPDSELFAAGTAIGSSNRRNYVSFQVLGAW